MSEKEARCKERTHAKRNTHTHTHPHPRARPHHPFHPPRHSLHAISSQLSPRPGCTGIEHVAADTFDLHCFQALTGTKFLAVAAPGSPGLPPFLAQTVYSLYCDFVLKNPFYEAEMPVRCEAFEGALAGAVRKWGAGG